MAKQFHLRLKRSLIGTTQKQREAVRCLGLRKVNSTVVVADNPAMRGQIMVVHHLLDVQLADRVNAAGKVKSENRTGEKK